jgi:hypothetical protein
MSDLLYLWRKKRGLDYNGWLAFIVKRWLRQNGLGFMIPFHMMMDWRDSSNVTLTIWEWGKTKQEKIKFSDGIYASEIVSRLRELGMTNSKDKYKVLLALGKRI